MRPLCFLLFIIISSSSFSYSQNKEALRNTIKKLLIEQKLSGAVWSIVAEPGKVVTDAYGYKNVKQKVLLSPTNKVHVGSVSKTILALGILRMATVGLLNLDDPIKRFLPKFQIDNPWDKTNPVTIRHLLDHTSGMTDAKLWHVFSTTATPSTPLETAFFNDPAILKVQARPGSMYSYSNLGYTILGIIIEKITQIRYEDYLAKELLNPLNMVNSSFHFISQNTDNQLAYGHFDHGEPVAAMPMYLRPAGQLTTSAEDIGKFLLFLMSNGTINGKQFIHEKYLASISNQKFTDAHKLGVPFGDALGAYSRDRYGVVGIAKNGNTLGFSSMIYLFPREKKAFFIAHNMDSETANYDLFNEAMVKHLNLPNRQFIANNIPTETEITNWNGYYVPVITKVHPFGLIDYLFSHTKVETSKKSALLIPFQGKNKLLVYQGKHMFSMRDRTNISHSFYKTAEGSLLITDGVSTIKRVSGLRILAIAVSALLGLSGLLYFFLAGCINLIRNRFNCWHRPIFWMFISIFMMLISFVFIATQPFMRLGDMTPGNILLAVSTSLIPMFSIVLFISTSKTQMRSIFSFDFWASVFVTQFCALLIANKLMPIILWK